MNFFLTIVVIPVVVVAALAIWIRTVSPDPARFARPAEMPEPGTHTTMVESVTVLTPPDPAAAFQRLADIVASAPRTTEVARDPDHRAFVVRTWVMGFPDVIHVWHDGTHLAIRGKLTLGKGDAGVNKRRNAEWLKKADLTPP